MAFHIADSGTIMMCQQGGNPPLSFFFRCTFLPAHPQSFLFSRSCFGQNVRNSSSLIYQFSTAMIHKLTVLIIMDHHRIYGEGRYRIILHPISFRIYLQKRWASRKYTTKKGKIGKMKWKKKELKKKMIKSKVSFEMKEYYTHVFLFTLISLYCQFYKRKKKTTWEKALKS